MEEAAAGRPWTVVTQVKSNRVVYFTDDPDYAPPMEGDWYYVTVHHGALPERMTLRNCWRWRFNGGRFVDAGEAPKPSKATALLDANRRALREILDEKIDAVRAPFAPSCRDGEQVRERKRAEARAFLDLGPDGADTARFPLLEATALARRISLSEAAHLVLAKEAERSAVQVASERFREQLARAIENATDEAGLLAIREWLLDRVYPELSQQFRFTLLDTEPLDPDAPVPEAHRVHEIACLKAMLREAINEARRPLRSEYVFNEELRLRKLRQAAMVAAGRPIDGAGSGGGEGLGLLRTYAEARGLSLEEAAEITLRSAAVADEILKRTEAIKDRLMARIEGCRTLRDIRTLADEIRAIGGTIGKDA